MDVTPPAAPLPGIRRHPRLQSWRTWWWHRSPLARDITVVLIVKAALLGVLWFAFFRTPMAPGMMMPPHEVAGRMIAQPHPEDSRAVP